MIRKSLSIVILLSLVLHCAGRTGFLSYLYKQRHEIAYAMGLIDEVPIAVCSAAYFGQENGLTVQITDDNNVPTVLTTAAEIVLFFMTPEFSSAADRSLLAEDISTHHLTGLYGSPDLDFFQPPRI